MKLAKLTKSFLKSVACIFALVSISSCQEDMETMYMQSSENTVLTEQLNAAKRWYEIQKSNGKTRSVDSQMQMYKEDPSWKYFAVNRRKDFTAVDIDLTDCISLDFVPQDNYEAFQRTGNWDFRRSYTRLVYTFDKKNNKEKGFLMTIVPSKYYAKTYSKRIRRNTYLHRDKYLSGYVLFHHLDGTFANGWEYKRGKVIRKVNMKMQTGDLNSGRILMHTLSANYTVTPKVYSPTQTRSDSEGDGDINGGWLGEVVITPDPDPDPYPDLPTSWVDWLDDPDPEPDPDDGWYWDDEDGYVGSEDDPPTIPTVVYDIMESTNMNQNQIAKLKDAIDHVKHGPLGDKVYADMFNNHVKISFNIYTKFPDKIAFFDRKTNSIYFNGENKITGENLIEELIHAVQYNIYYGTLMNNELRNFDFEAKVLRDIDCDRRNNIGCAVFGEVGMGDNSEYCHLYEHMIYDFVQWNKEMHDLYNSLGEIWNQYPGDFDSTISPKLLINYLKQK